MTIEITYLRGNSSTFSGEESYKLIFEAVCLSDLEMLDNEHLAEVAPYTNGENLREDVEHQREALTNFAKEYQRAQSELSTSYEELAFWSGFFEEYGEKLGLSEEFKENGII